MNWKPKCSVAHIQKLFRNLQILIISLIVTIMNEYNRFTAKYQFPVIVGEVVAILFLLLSCLMVYNLFCN